MGGLECWQYPGGMIMRIRGYEDMKLGHDHYGRWMNKEHTNKHECVQLHSEFCTNILAKSSSLLHICIMAISTGSNHHVLQTRGVNHK
jgi:hypothetical protein